MSTPGNRRTMRGAPGAVVATSSVGTHNTAAPEKKVIPISSASASGPETETSTQNHVQSRDHRQRQGEGEKSRKTGSTSPGKEESAKDDDGEKIQDSDPEHDGVTASDTFHDAGDQAPATPSTNPDGSSEPRKVTSEELRDAVLELLAEKEEAKLAVAQIYATRLYQLYRFLRPIVAHTELPNPFALSPTASASTPLSTSSVAAATAPAEAAEIDTESAPASGTHPALIQSIPTDAEDDHAWKSFEKEYPILGDGTFPGAAAKRVVKAKGKDIPLPHVTGLKLHEYPFSPDPQEYEQDQDAAKSGEGLVEGKEEIPSTDPDDDDAEKESVQSVQDSQQPMEVDDEDVEKENDSHLTTEDLQSDGQQIGLEDIKIEFNEPHIVTDSTTDSVTSIPVDAQVPNADAMEDVKPDTDAPVQESTDEPTANPNDVIPPPIHIPEAFQPRRPVYVPRVVVKQETLESGSSQLPDASGEPSSRRAWIQGTRLFTRFQPDHHPLSYPPATAGLFDVARKVEDADEDRDVHLGWPESSVLRNGEEASSPDVDAVSSLIPLESTYSSSLEPVPFQFIGGSHHHHPPDQESHEPFLGPMDSYDLSGSSKSSKPSPSLRQRVRSMLVSGYGLTPGYANKRRRLEEGGSSEHSTANHPPPLIGTHSTEPPETNDIYETGFIFAANPLSKVIGQRSNKCVSSRDWQTAWAEIKYVKALEKVEQLKEEQRWSFRQPKKQRTHATTKSHWDWLLDEMRWMQTDFREERRWKIAVAYEISHAVKLWHEVDSPARAAMSVGSRPWGQSRKRSAVPENPDLETSETDRVLEELGLQSGAPREDGSADPTQTTVSKATSADGEGEPDPDADGEADEDETDKNGPAQRSASVDPPKPIIQVGAGGLETLAQPSSLDLISDLAPDIRKPLLEINRSANLVDIAELVRSETGTSEIPPDADISLQTLFPDLALYGNQDPPRPEQRRADEAPGRLAHVSRLLDLKPVFVSALQPGQYRQNCEWVGLRDEEPLHYRATVEDDRSTSPQPVAPLFAGKKGKSHLDFAGRRPPEQPRNHLMRSVLVQWDDADDALLERLLLEYPSNWELIADAFNSARNTIPTDRRTAWDCYDRWDKRFGPSSQKEQPAQAAVNVPPAVAQSSAAAEASETAGTPDGAAADDANRVKLSKSAKFEGSRKKVRLMSLREATRKISRRRDNMNKKPQSVKNVVHVHESHNAFLDHRQAATPQELSRLQHDLAVQQAQQMREAQMRAQLMRQQLAQQQQQASKMQQAQQMAQQGRSPVVLPAQGAPTGPQPPNAAAIGVPGRGPPTPATPGGSSIPMTAQQLQAVTLLSQQRAQQMALAAKLPNGRPVPPAGQNVPAVGSPRPGTAGSQPSNGPPIPRPASTGPNKSSPQLANAGNRVQANPGNPNPAIANAIMSGQIRLPPNLAGANLTPEQLRALQAQFKNAQAQAAARQNQNAGGPGPAPPHPSMQQAPPQAQSSGPPKAG